MALTTQDIHAAADRLQEQGIKPTLAEVRKALGGGSFTTISDAMQSWKREQQEEQELQQGIYLVVSQNACTRLGLICGRRLLIWLMIDCLKSVKL